MFGQINPKVSPFILQGQINKEYLAEFLTKNNTVKIEYSDQFDQIHFDTTSFDELGNFYYETNEIKKPVRINLVFEFDDFQNILAAPGYNLTFVQMTTKKHEFTLIGKGSRASKYYRLLDSIPTSRFYSISWWDLNEADFIRQINRTQQVRDSVSHAVYDHNDDPDLYFDYLGKMTRMDNKFEKLKYLFLYADHEKLNYSRSIAFVKRNFDPEFFKNLNNEDYLISSEFRSGMSTKLPNSFLNYMLLLDNPNDSITDVHNLSEKFKAEKANSMFKGALRAFVLCKIIEFPIWTFRSVEALNQYMDGFKTFQSVFSDEARTAEEKMYSEKMMRLMVEERPVSKNENEKANAFVGKPAPPFTMMNNQETIYQLSDFKGKMVVLNLWASWCNSCRFENDAFKKLVKKYNKNNNVTFVSIAVYDNYQSWKDTLKVNRPGGIQLFDRDRIVFDAYIDEHIPKFVVIDKQGNVINFMAPKPSEGEELDKLIRRELEKKEQDRKN